MTSRASAVGLATVCRRGLDAHRRRNGASNYKRPLVGRSSGCEAQAREPATRAPLSIKLERAASRRKGSPSSSSGGRAACSGTGLRSSRMRHGSGDESDEQSLKRQAELGRLLAAAEGYRVVASDGASLGWLDHVRYQKHADIPTRSSFVGAACRRGGDVPFPSARSRP
jgi:hypothetical protein